MAHVVYFILPVFWIGLLVGVCFIATPAKYLAPTLARPVAMDVGRVTFALWNDVEWLVLALLVPPLVLLRPDLFIGVATFILGLLLLIQTAVLLPALEGRAKAIQAGTRPPRSADHHNYVLIDILKVCILLAMVWRQTEIIAARLAG